PDPERAVIVTDGVGGLKADSPTITLRADSENYRVCLFATVLPFSGRYRDVLTDIMRTEVTDAFIDVTYEETYRRFSAEFGRTIKGFFGDETGFENFGSYDLLFGADVPSFPWTLRMLDEFRSRKDYDLAPLLPALWFEYGGNTEKVRYDMMDVLTTLLSENFFKRIQVWCRGHNVQFIGHVVEDNGAHAHHGYGAGHFYRMLKHFDMGGYDLVAQVIPGKTEGLILWGVWEWKSEFFYWAMAKMADSASNLFAPSQPTMCENFGAYGWSLGLRWMKWLSDWQIVRGTDFFVPHAFNPRYPDDDCPPHFFAAGRNPQWRYWRYWADYVNRACLMLRGGRHVAQVGVLYHAESEWAGGQDSVMPLETVARSLMTGQIDFEFVSYESLLGAMSIEGQPGVAKICGVDLKAIVLPKVEFIPIDVMRKLLELAKHGVTIVALEGPPTGDTGGRHDMVQSLAEQTWDGSLANTIVASADQIAAIMRSLGFWDIEIEGRAHPLLQYYYTDQQGLPVYFFNNERIDEAFEGWIVLRQSGLPEFWHALAGTVGDVPVYKQEGNFLKVHVKLEPYESVFLVVKPFTSVMRHIEATTIPEIIFEEGNMLIGVTSIPGSFNVAYSDGSQESYAVPDAHLSPIDLVEKWRVVRAGSLETKSHAPLGNYGLGNLNEIDPETFDAFAGTAIYRSTFDYPYDPNVYFVEINLGDVWETVQLFINGHDMGVKLCPPYRYVISSFLQEGENSLEIRVTNTLHSEIRDRYSGERFPFGILGPVRVETKYRIPLG
ncbi:MAG: glycosyl hydrolase, partial [Bacilli bacterium]